MACVPSWRGYVRAFEFCPGGPAPSWVRWLAPGEVSTDGLTLTYASSHPWTGGGGSPTTLSDVLLALDADDSLTDAVVTASMGSVVLVESDLYFDPLITLPAGPYPADRATLWEGTVTFEITQGGRTAELTLHLRYYYEAS